MAYYARVNSENTVIHITPILDEMIADENGGLNEEKGKNHLYNTIPDSKDDLWVLLTTETKVAGIGYTWDKVSKKFIAKKPYDSWIFNPTTFEWEPPIPMPNNATDYHWNESLLNWVPKY
jgi:hypothetical protein